MLNEKSLENLLYVIKEADGGFDSTSDEWKIHSQIEDTAFRFKLHMKNHWMSFVAYKKKKADEYYLHSLTAKGYPLTREEFDEYFLLLKCVGKMEIVRKTEHGKKPK